RADARDEVRHATVGVGPDLGAGRLVVRRRAVRVGVLVRLPGARDLLDEAVRDRVVGVGVVGRDRRRRDDDARPVRTQHVALVLAHLVRADEHAVVPLALRDEREPYAGVAGRGLDDRAARAQLARRLRGLDHLQRDAVLHGPAGGHVLDLGEDRRAEAFGDTGQPGERGSAAELGPVLCLSHAPDPPRPGTARVTAPAARRTPPAAREFPYAVERWTSRPTPDREVTRAPNHDDRHHADRA